jgi:LytS/YehU family sensor histidine kinase
MMLLYISTWGICFLFGRLSVLAYQKSQRELEIETLKTENLQSRYKALDNQMHPHFFFNSLNSMSALIRSGRTDDSLRFLNEMSRVFRYILQIGTDTMTSLEREMKFTESYLYMLSIRYHDNLTTDIDIAADQYVMRLPTLSLLPVIENIVKHNVIDSSHLMNIAIYIDTDGMLTVRNRIFKKLSPVISDKVGLRNLSERYRLLTGTPIIVDYGEEFFTVHLPLTK